MKKLELTKRQACEALAMAKQLRDAARQGDWVNVVFYADLLPDCIVRKMEPCEKKKALLGWSFEIQALPTYPTAANWLQVGYEINPKDPNDAKSRDSVRTFCRDVLEPAAEWVNYLETVWPSLRDNVDCGAKKGRIPKVNDEKDKAVICEEFARLRKTGLDAQEAYRQIAEQTGNARAGGKPLKQHYSLSVDNVRYLVKTK